MELRHPADGPDAVASRVGRDLVLRAQGRAKGACTTALRILATLLAIAVVVVLIA